MKKFIIYQYYNSDIREKMLTLTTPEDLKFMQALNLRKDAVIIAENLIKTNEKVTHSNGFTMRIYKNDSAKYGVFHDNSAIIIA